MSKKIRTEAVDYLFQAILSLENKEECYTFLEDISGDRGEDRSIHCDNQSCEPFS